MKTGYMVSWAAVMFAFAPFSTGAATETPTDKIRNGFEGHRQCMMQIAKKAPLDEGADVSHQAALSICRESLILSMMANLRVEMDNICPFELPPQTCDPERNTEFAKGLETRLRQDFLAEILRRKMSAR